MEDMKKVKEVFAFDAYELQKYEPNRYPFLFIDRVTECVPGEYAKGYKNLTNNEWFFPYHLKDIRLCQQQFKRKL